MAANTHPAPPSWLSCNPSLSAGHLAWVSGPYTVVFDLTAGSSKLLGIARRTGTAPAVSEQYAVWLDEAPGGSASPSIWSYRFATSARRRFGGTPSVVAAPALSGSTLVWAGRLTGSSRTAAGSDIAVVARDLTSGAVRVVARGPQIAYPVVACWPRVGWGENAARTVAAQPSYHFAVKDVATGQTSRIDLLAGAPSGTLMNIALSGTTLVWRLQTDGGSGEILVRDLTGGTTQPVASGPGLSGGSIDGGRVVWSQPGAGGTSIMCRRLSGGSPFVVATVATGTVTDVLVSRGTVAWVVRNGQGGFSGIETGRLAQ